MTPIFHYRAYKYMVTTQQHLAANVRPMFARQKINETAPLIYGVTRLLYNIDDPKCKDAPKPYNFACQYAAQMMHHAAVRTRLRKLHRKFFPKANELNVVCTYCPFVNVTRTCMNDLESNYFEVVTHPLSDLEERLGEQITRYFDSLRSWNVRPDILVD